jgi:hypothetical protein
MTITPEDWKCMCDYLFQIRRIYNMQGVSETEKIIMMKKEVLRIRLLMECWENTLIPKGV